MGLFDKLAKKGLEGLKDKLEQATGVDLDNVAEKLADAAGDAVKDKVPAAQATAAPANNNAALPADLKAHFARILADEFSSYEVRTEAAADNLGFAAASPAKPYDFALIKGGKTAGVVMLTPHNRDRNAAFKNAKAAAAKARVPFINFYDHYPNERSYVIERIKSFL